MDKNSIIKSVQRQDEEKVGFSLKLPASLKEDLQALCEANSISMNALIVGTLHSLINDDCGQELKSMKRLLLTWREELGHEWDRMFADPTINPDNPPYEMQERISKIASFLNQIDKVIGV